MAALAPPLLLTRKDVARTLSVCERTIFNLVRRGELREIKLGSAPRYAPADVEALITRLRGDGPAPAAN